MSDFVSKKRCFHPLAQIGICPFKNVTWSADGQTRTTTI